MTTDAIFTVMLYICTSRSFLPCFRYLTLKSLIRESSQGSIDRKIKQWSITRILIADYIHAIHRMGGGGGHALRKWYYTFVALTYNHVWKSYF